MWRPVLYRPVANKRVLRRCVCLDCDMLRCRGIPLWAPVGGLWASRHREATDVKARRGRSVPASARRRLRSSDDERSGLCMQRTDTVSTPCTPATSGFVWFRQERRDRSPPGRNAVLKPLPQVHRFDHQRKQSGRCAIGRRDAVAQTPSSRPWSLGRNHAHAPPNALDVRVSVGLPSSPAIG